MSEQKKNGKTVIVICAAVIVVLLAAVIYLLMSRKEEEPEKRNVVVNRDNVEDVVDGMLNREYVEPGYYSASMTTTWHFSTGDAVSEDAYVANLEENTNDVYFDIFLEENEEEAIYKSPILPRGSELGSIALDKPLSAGTYDCVMIYHLIDEDMNTLSTLRVGFTIIVEQ